MTTYTAFDGPSIIATGDMAQMIAAQRAASENGVNLLIFDDASGKVRDVDLRDAPPPTRGRPKLGVTAREVTLLPRHWDWLGNQRGGASAALRRLVDGARKADQAQANPKAAVMAVHSFLSSIAGDLPNYEEALRNLYAGDADGFASQIADWPADIRGYAHQLAGMPI